MVATSGKGWTFGICRIYVRSLTMPRMDQLVHNVVQLLRYAHVYLYGSMQFINPSYLERVVTSCKGWTVGIY